MARPHLTADATLSIVESRRRLRHQTSCPFTSLGVGKCRSTSCQNWDGLFEECQPTIAWPHEGCAENCSDDPLCTGYSQSVSYSSSGGSGGVTIYNVCVYYTDSTPEAADGERWGLGKADPECMVKIADECRAITEPPSTSPTVAPTVAPRSWTNYDAFSKPVFIATIVGGSVAAILFIVFACRIIRSKVIRSDKNVDGVGSGASSSPGVATFGDPNERERHDNQKLNMESSGVNALASIFGVGAGGGFASGSGGGIFGTGAGVGGGGCGVDDGNGGFGSSGGSGFNSGGGGFDSGSGGFDSGGCGGGGGFDSGGCGGGGGGFDSGL